MLCLVGMMEMMGVVAIGKTVIRHTSASSWFEEAEASDGNSARDAQGGELERAKVQRGTFGVLPTVLQLSLIHISEPTRP